MKESVAGDPIANNIGKGFVKGGDRGVPVPVQTKPQGPSPQDQNDQTPASREPISLGIKTGEKPPPRAETTTPAPDDGVVLGTEPTEDQSNVIDLSSGPVRVRVGSNVVDLDTDYVTNASNLGKAHSRKMNVLAARERELQLASERITRVANDPMMRTYQALLDGGKSEDEARSEVARMFTAAPQKQEEEIGAMPVPPPEAMPGTEEWNDYEVQRTEWLAKANEVNLRKALAPILSSNESAQHRAEQQAQLRAIGEHNQEMGVKIFDYLPFDYSALSEGDQLQVRERLAEESRNRGFDWSDQQALHSRKVSDEFLEIVALSAFPNGSAPQQQQPQAPQQRPVVGQAPPTPPLAPPVSVTGVRVLSPDSQRRPSNGNASWVSKLGPVSKK